MPGGGEEKWQTFGQSLPSLNYRYNVFLMTRFADRTIWSGDKLEILRGLNSALVDLIYMDPPFNSNRNYAAPVPYCQKKHVLFGQQEGSCNGCRSEFPFRVFEVDHVIPRSSGGQKTSKTCRCFAPTATGSRATGRRSI